MTEAQTNKVRRTPRRWFVPEVIQASPMDCGPASLYSLLAGFGVPVSFDELRNTCQTDVDGTSIDVLQEVAEGLGLDARQLLVPIDHVGHARTDSLPAIAVTQVPGGALHFIVIWRRFGPWLQIMDPSSGRRWLRASTVRARLYRQSVPLPAQKWRASRTTLAARGVLEEAMGHLGIHDGRARIESALADPGWRGIAALEAAVRMADSLVTARAIRRGGPAARLVDALVERAVRAQSFADTQIPAVYWSVQPAAPEADSSGEPMLNVRGALTVRAHRLGPPSAEEAHGQASTARVKLRRGSRLSVRRALAAHFTSLDKRSALGFASLSAVAALAVLFQALLFRGLFEVGAHLSVDEQRLGAMVSLLAFLIGLTLLELPLAHGLLRMGRVLEGRVRRSFQETLPTLTRAWFDSRPNSDLAERAHALFSLREFPPLTGRIVRTIASLALTSAGLLWIDPNSWAWVLLAISCSIVLPLAFQRTLLEREMLVRGHHGALSRFYLEALLGLVASRVHGAQRALRREHEALLVEWYRAGLKLAHGATFLRGSTALVTTAAAIALVVDHLNREGTTPATLLFAYWALALPGYGNQLAHNLLAVHPLANASRRALEPIQAATSPAAGGASDAPQQSTDLDSDGEALDTGELHPHFEAPLKAAGASHWNSPDVAPASAPPTSPAAPRITFRGMSLTRSGQTVLEALDLEIASGEHVAIVGRSGAGKSSLVALLLGLHTPTEGALLVDGEPLESVALERLRRGTAWVDPSVQLWNKSAFANLVYGSGATSESALAGVLDEAHLTALATSLPEGLATSLGEGGALVSGGEGQRLRFARALLRSDQRLALLDEPFRGVDRRVRGELLATARERWCDATLLCVTHDVAATLDFDRVLVLERGRLVELGDPRRLSLDGTSHYARLLRAERELIDHGWRELGWKRWYVEDGRLDASAGSGTGAFEA